MQTSEKTGPVVEYKNRFDAPRHREPTRNETLRGVDRYVVRIECMTNGLIVGNYVLNEGTYDVVLYEDEIPKIEAMVETEFGILSEAKSRVDKENAEFRESGRDDSEKQWGSFPRTFRLLANRDVLPLKSVTKGKCLGMPKTDDERKAEGAYEHLMSANSKLFLDGIRLLLEEQSKSDKSTKK